jgi:predicted unusual protein kinase regulating ubiquinone biosynthesis (AarF/ABC1/UbiB family)
VRIPRVLQTTQHFIVMEHAVGSPLHLLNHTDSRRANTARAKAFAHMTTSGDRRFHADLHDGNVLYDTNTDTLWLIDFGLCAHPPPDWEPPLLAITRHASNPVCPGSTSDMLCALFSIEKKEADVYVPILYEIIGHANSQNQSLRDSTRAFFTFTHRVGLYIQPHTIAYFMQLLNIEQGVQPGELVETPSPHTKTTMEDE